MQHAQPRDQQVWIGDALVRIGIEQPLEQVRDRARELDVRRLGQRRQPPPDAGPVEADQLLGPSPRHLAEHAQAQQAADAEAIRGGSPTTRQHLRGQEPRRARPMTPELAEIGEHDPVGRRDDDVVGADITVVGAQPVDGCQRMCHPERLGQRLRQWHRSRADGPTLDEARHQPNSGLGVVDQLEGGREMG